VRRDVASDLGLSGGADRRPLRTLVAGQTVGNWRAPDDQTYDVNVRLAPEAATPEDLERPAASVGTNADGSAHRAAEPGRRRERRAPARTRSTGAT
jgi:hydrophobic/amphiphilic exporter-1 (mainly G- bacteria), HAE1 family